VRVTHAWLHGKIGQIVDLLPEGATLPNGITVAAAQVRIGSDEPVILPLANLEIVGIH
jgi:hypothetical protein